MGGFQGSYYSLTGIFRVGYNLCNNSPPHPQRRCIPVRTSTLNALAEPNRLQIVELLIRQPLTVGEIATRLHMRQPQASKHLRVLSDAGIIEVEAIANRRLCKLRPEPFRELDDWLTPYRHLWEARLDRLDDYLRRLQQQPAPPPSPGKPPTSDEE